MDKENVLYATKKYLVKKRKRKPAICDNMDEPGGHPSKKEKL